LIFRTEIVSQQYNFGRDAMEAAEVKSVSKAEILQFYDRFIAAESRERRKIACHVVSTVEEPENGGGDSGPEVEVEAEPPVPCPEPVLVENVVAFKAAHPLWPLAKSYKDLGDLVRKSSRNEKSDVA
jgi:hypothetical protein